MCDLSYLSIHFDRDIALLISIVYNLHAKSLYWLVSEGALWQCRRCHRQFRLLLLVIYARVLGYVVV